MTSTVQHRSGMGTASATLGVLALANLVLTSALTTLAADGHSRGVWLLVGGAVLVIFTSAGFPMALKAWNRAGIDGADREPARWGLILNEGVWILAAGWFLGAMLYQLSIQ
jgi:hypothetical protein